MIVVFACVILKEKITAKKITALIMSFAGIVVLSLGSASASENKLFGIIACIAAAVCYGLFSVLNKKHNLNQSITMMWFWLIVAICSLFAGLLFEKWQEISGVQFIGIAWLGIVVNAIAYLLWAIALKNADDSAKIANLAYLVPFLSIIISAVVLKEQMSINTVIAAALIVGGIILQAVNIKKPAERRPENK